MRRPLERITCIFREVAPLMVARGVLDRGGRVPPHAMPPTHAQLAALGAHHERMRGLARALLRDEHAAEDVVQDAWVRSLQSGPDDPGALRAWLDTVVRRLAFNRLRGATRRTRREELAAREEQVPSSEEVAAELEASRRLTEAIDELGEPGRSLLRDRYLGGLTPSEIARRDGLTLDTVKGRLARARRALRSGLGKADHGAGDAWRMALLPLASAGRDLAAGAASAAASTSTTLLPAGALAMKKFLAAAAALVLAFTGWRVASSGSPDLDVVRGDLVRKGAGAVAEDAASAASTGSEAIDSIDSIDSIVAGAPDREDGATASRWFITGSVQILDLPGTSPTEPGQPVRVRLLLLGDGPEEDKKQTLQSQTVTTDAGGLFAWTPAPFDGAAWLRAQVELEGYEAIPIADLLVEAASRPDPLRLFLQKDGLRIEGTVVSATGDPVPGTTVRFGDQRTTTDDQGRYAGSIGRAIPHRVSAIVKGHGMGTALVEGARNGDTFRVDLRLPAEVVISGTVRDEAGRGVEGAHVTTFYYSDLAVRTDAEGRFTMRHVPRDLRDSVSVFARAEGFCEASADATIPLVQNIQVDLVLRRGAEVRGHVVDESGAHAAGLDVFIGFSQFAFNRLDATTATDGSFVFPVVPAGAQTLWILEDDHAPVRHDFVVEEGASNVEDIELVLTRGRTISGTVRDVDGSPLGGIYVIGARDHETFGKHVETGEDGRFEISGVPAGSFDLEVMARGWVDRTVSFEADDQWPFDVEIEPAGCVRGRVVDAATGAPIETFKVRFVDPELAEGEQRIWGYDATWAREGKRFTNPSGSWSTESEDLSVGGVIGIQVMAKGYAPAVIRHAVVEPMDAATEVLVELGAPVELHVRVVRKGEGTPLEDVVVTANQGGRFQELDFVWRGQTDAAGEVVLEGVSTGGLYLSAGQDGEFERHFGPFEVQASGGEDLVLEIAAGGPLHGVVRAAPGEPGLAGATIQLHPVETENLTRRHLEVSTDANGHYEFESVPPGRYYIARRGHDGFAEYVPFGALIDVPDTAGGSAFDLIPPSGSAELVIELLGEGERGGSTRVSIRLNGRPGFTWTLPLTEASLALKSLPAGSYEVSALHLSAGRSRRWEPRSVQLRAGERIEVELALESEGR